MLNEHNPTKTLKLFYSTLKFVWDINRKYIILTFICELLNTAKAIPYMFLIKNAVAIISQGKDYLRYIIEIIILLLIIYMMDFIYAFFQKNKAYEKNALDISLKDIIFEKNSKTDYFIISTKEYFSLKRKAMEAYNQNCIEKNVSMFFSIISGLVVLLGLSFTLRYLGWLMLLPIILSIGVRILAEFFDRKAYYIRITKLTDINRKSNYLHKICEGESYAKEVRIFNMEDKFEDKLVATCDEKLGVWKKYMKKFRHSSATYEIADVLLQLFLYIFLGYRVLIVADINIDDFVYLFTACQQVQNVIGNIALKCMDIYSNTYFLHDFMEYFKSDYTDTDKEKTNSKVAFPKTQRLIVEFKNVSFIYPNTNEYALKNINTKLEQGKSYLIVGKNGAGKSTFIKLLSRLYKPTEGEITLNGINIEDISMEEYWKNISVLFQDNKMLSFSIKENITSLNSPANMEKLESVCKNIGVYDKIISLPKEFDTSYSRNFDEYGVEFSGGERQKLMLSKALYKNSYISIFDEPTSGVDAISDEKMYKSVQDHSNNKIIIYITHKLSTGQECDNILVFNNAEIAETGNHQQLMKNDGIYATLYKLQAELYSGDNDEK